MLGGREEEADRVEEAVMGTTTDPVSGS